jgi:hypothetical protein
MKTFIPFTALFSAGILIIVASSQAAEAAEAHFGGNFIQYANYVPAYAAGSGSLLNSFIDGYPPSVRFTVLDYGQGFQYEVTSSSTSLASPIALSQNFYGQQIATVVFYGNLNNVTSGAVVRAKFTLVITESAGFRPATLKVTAQDGFGFTRTILQTGNMIQNGAGTVIVQ